MKSQTFVWDFVIMPHEADGGRMDWLTEAGRKLRHGNRILFTRESLLLQDLRPAFLCMS